MEIGQNNVSDVSHPTVFLIDYRRCCSDRPDSPDGGDTNGLFPNTAFGHVLKITAYKTAVLRRHETFRSGGRTQLIA